MNKKISFLVIAMLLVDILDGDFARVSVLDVVKLVLYVVCIVLILKKGEN